MGNSLFEGEYAELAKPLWNTSPYWWDISAAATLDAMSVLVREWAEAQDVPLLDVEPCGLAQLIEEVRSQYPTEADALQRFKDDLSAYCAVQMPSETPSDHKLYTNIVPAESQGYDPKQYPAPGEASGNVWWMGYHTVLGIWRYIPLPRDADLTRVENSEDGWQSEPPQRAQFTIVGIGEQGDGWWYGYNTKAASEADRWRYLQSATQPYGNEQGWTSATEYKRAIETIPARHVQEDHDATPKDDVDLWQETVGLIADELREGLIEAGFKAESLPPHEELQEEAERLLSEQLEQDEISLT